jgi:signal transduction histidine kinase
VEDLTATHHLQTHVRHQERLATVGRFAAGVAHEIGNPLAGLLMVAQNLSREASPEALPERLGQVVALARRIDDIVHSLVSFTRAGEASVETRHEVRLAEVAREAVTLVKLTRARSVRLEVDGSLPWVRASGSELVQVMVNLLLNAFDASPADSEVVIRGSTDGAWAVLAVADEGSGIRAEVVPHLFEPFFTTKEPGKGTGLGLWVAWTIVTTHGGTLEVHPNGARGTVISVRLPVHRAAS